MATLTKAKIVEDLFTKNLLPKGETAHAIETMFELIKQTLERGDDVFISGFGRLSVQNKNRRRDRNPQTGEPMMLDTRRVVTLGCSGVLREKINREK